MAYLNHNNIVEFSYMTQLIKRTILCSILLLISSHAYSAGLGKIHVKSALGESLVAEIDIIESQAEQTTTLNARLGNAEEYAAAGLQDSILPSSVHAQIIRHADNSRVIQIVSDRPVNDPFIEMLVKVESSTVNILRQYTVLLDPPYSKLNDDLNLTSKEGMTSPLSGETNQKLYSNNIVEPQSHKGSRKSQRKNSVNQNVHNEETIKSPEVTENVYITQSGDVFGKVAQQYQPAGVSLKKVMAAFYEANPDAFVNGDMNHLKAGQTLKVPKLEGMAPSDSKAKTSKANSEHKAKELASKSANEEVLQKAPEDTTKFVLKVSPAEVSPQPKVNDAKENAAVATNNTAKDASIGKLDRTDVASNLMPVPDNSAPETVKPQPADTEQSSTGEASATINQPANQPKPVTTNQQEPKPIVIETNADPSFLNALLANLKWILIGMILPSIFFIAVLILNKRRTEHLRALQESFYQDVGEEIDPIQPTITSTKDSFKTDQVTQLSDEAQVPDGELSFENEAIKTFDNLQPLGEPTVNESVKYNSQPPTNEDTEIDIHEVDPLVEAEIYISYGRLEQAEGILKNALIKSPYKLELIMMLLKLYKDKNEKKSFESLARNVYEATENGDITDPVIWAKVALLGGKFDPTNSLYQIEGVANDGHARAQDQDNLIFDDAYLDTSGDVSEIVSFEEQLTLDELTELPKGASNLDDELDENLKSETITGLGLIEKESGVENVFDPDLIGQESKHDQNVIEFILDDIPSPNNELAKGDNPPLAKGEHDSGSLDDLFGEHPKS